MLQKERVWYKDALYEGDEKVSKIYRKEHTMALEYRYVSTYGTATGISIIVSFVGWVILALSILLLVGVMAALSQAPTNQSFDMFIQSFFFIRVLTALGGIISGLLLIVTGQFSRATLDSADHSGEMLAIMKANLDAWNTRDGLRADIPVSPSATRLVPSPATTTAHGLTGREAETVSVEPRVIEIPPGVENQKLSVREAAQTISVPNGILQGYIKSGRLTPNPDGTIDLYALYHAGFIVRNLPPNRDA